MLFSEALKGQRYEFVGGDTEIKGISNNSRDITAGDIFTAVTGLNHDGHLYCEQAVKNGAAAIIVERFQPNIAVPQAVVENSRRSLAKTARHVYGYPDKKLQVVGVTGTNGKTTTTLLIKAILEAQGFKTGLIGTISNMIGNTELETGHTTPEAHQVYRLLNEMYEQGCKYVAIEVSSHALAQNRVEDLEFAVGVFTNLSLEHLDYHKTMQCYAKEKAKLFSMCKKAVINADDEYSDMMRAACDCEILTYGIDNEADYSATDIKLSRKGVIYNLAGQQVRVGIPGRFSVYNSLAAFSVCDILGISSDDICKTLSIAKGVPGRAELVPLPVPYSVIIDYAHTPDGLENILKTLRGFVTGRIISVFGCGGDRDASKRPLMGRIAHEPSDFCFVTSDNARTENPQSIIDDIIKGMPNSSKYRCIVDREQAIEQAMRFAQSDDCILLAGKGHETYQILGRETIPFDERVIVNAVCEKIKLEQRRAQ